MRIVIALTVSFALALLAVPPSAADDEGPSYQATEVAPGIWMMEGINGFAGGNVGLLVGPEKVVLIDDAMESTAPGLLEKAKEIAGRAPDFVINTHVHGDHVGGNAVAAGTGALVVAHRNIRKRLIEDPAPAGGDAGLPVITFSDEVSFHVNGTEVRVFHVESAHTDGDGVVHFPDADVILAGDILFHGLFPFIDLDSGGSVDGFIAGQRKLLELAGEGTVIVPGHGGVTTRAGLQEALDMLVDCRERVRKLVEEGQTADEIVAVNPLADYHDGWNWGFITTERMTRTLVRALASGS